MNRFIVLLLGGALASAASVTLAADSQAPDFVGKCQAAAAAKTGAAASTVKVRGKYKGQDGRIMVDFRLADGRVGVCRAKANADVEEVKVEEAKAPAN
ncbi:MAG: hypothetical protein ACHQ6T_13280 [Myxococcota bacterium]